jgi:hypothetical protein
MRLRLLRSLGLAAAVLGAGSCQTLDTTRVAPPAATLGDDIYGILCDRVGASSFTEDLTGASYYSICHYDDTGAYANAVDISKLPVPATPAETAVRALSVAKLTRMAQRRSDLVHALNATFPDVMIQDVTSTNPSAQIGLHAALETFTAQLTQLYTTNPLSTAPGAVPLIPAQTRALSQLFASMDALGTCSSTGGGTCSYDTDCGTGKTCQSPVRDAFSHMWARRGYRPFQVGLGVVRPALAYPNLRTLTTSAISLLAPGGTAAPQLQQVLTVLKQELLTASSNVSALPPFTLNGTAATTAQPNRPRSDIEFTAALMLSQDPGFASAFSGTPTVRPIAVRDRRGIVVPKGNVPGTPGTVPTPFADLNNDGYADVDAFGEFLGADGNVLGTCSTGSGTCTSDADCGKENTCQTPLDSPFAIPGVTTSPTDPTSSASLFTVLDTSQTLVGGITQSLIPLVDPTVESAPGDPNGWMMEHETLMYALAGAYLLYGNRAPATYNYATEGKGGQPVTYSAFNAAASPLPDLLHAAGQVLADKDSDAILLSMLDLLQNHESAVARLMGAALQLRAIAKQHDALAAQGTEPLASLAYNVPIWDQMAQVLWHITQKQGLMTAMVGAMANPAVVKPDGGAQHMGDALSKFVSFIDRLDYNKHGTHYDGSTGGGINGPAVNLTVDPNGNAFNPPQTAINNNAAKVGTNVSCMERSLRLIHDANGGPACNKNGAVVNSKIGSITLAWPITGFPVYASPYTECQLFKFNNLASFYLDSLLPASHPKRADLQILASGLNDLISALTTLGAPFGLTEDSLLEESSDITGLTTHPTPAALNRLVFFGATTSNANYQGMPDLDTVNQGGQVNSFVSGSIDPISAAWCPPDGNGVPTSPNTTDTVRVQDPDTIFLWENFGFTDYLAPVVQALADSSCTDVPPVPLQPGWVPSAASCNTSDTSGEAIFGQVIDVLWQHWPTTADAPHVCSPDDKSVTCSGAGVSNYESLLADAFDSDFVPALNEFTAAAYNLSQITVQRGSSAGQTWTGAEVLEKLTTILFSQDYAKSVGMVDRSGNAGTTWTDGTVQSQVTVFTLFADALHKIDTSFANACVNAGANMTACVADATTRQGQWKQARSQLVDEFLTVDTTGPTPAFSNPVTVPMLKALLTLLRQQINANCPARETGTPCTWAQSGLDTELAGVIGRPLFAAAVDLGDQIRQDDTSRRQLETFLQYVLQSSNANGQALQGLLASSSDILQVLVDDGDLSPILASSAVGVSPAADPAGPGAADITVNVLKVLTENQYDQYHVINQVLPNLVTPMNGGQSLSPIEIFMDVISDIDRINSASQGPLAPDDYEATMSSLQSFMTDKSRGLEQLYTIIQNRPNE